MTIGPNTKAAIHRISEILPYLQADGAALPNGMSDQLDPIRQKAATLGASGPRDPRFAAGEDWITDQLQAGLDADEAESKKDASPAEPEPAPEATPTPLSPVPAEPASVPTPTPEATPEEAK